MKKIIVIGGNQGALAMAYKLGNIGYDVTVYEKKAREDVAYDWYDDIDPEIFSELNIPLPPENTFFKKKPWSFINPSETIAVNTGGGQEHDISVFRRPLNDYLFEYAKDKAKINYCSEVDSLITEDGKVCGAIVDGEGKRADLVVDCSGLNSKFRQSLPDEFGIQKNPLREEVFEAYRGFYQSNPDADIPEIKHKAYLRHNFKKGISWCVYTEEGLVDILIGRIGELTEEEKEEAFIALKKDNPILSDKLCKCGYTCKIPVRYPISRMVADGYVLAGDSAFMTIPMMGSGIVCSLSCAVFLSEVLAKNDDFSVRNLWNYQVKFYEKFAGYAGVDVLKRWLLKEKAEDIDFLFTSGVIDENIIAGGMDGNGVKLSFATLLKKAWQGRKRIGVLLRLGADMGVLKKAVKTAKKLPKVFDEKQVIKWQKKYDGIFNK